MKGLLCTNGGVEPKECETLGLALYFSQSIVIVFHFMYQVIINGLAFLV